MSRVRLDPQAEAGLRARLGIGPAVPIFFYRDDNYVAHLWGGKQAEGKPDVVWHGRQTTQFAFAYPDSPRIMRSGV